MDSETVHSGLESRKSVDPSSQATLGRSTGIDRSDVVAVINELAAAGHVERSPDPADRRRNLITLTATGKRRLQHLENLVSDTQATFLAPWTPPNANS